MPQISIHTSAREVTLKCTSRPTLYAISIHTSAREVTYPVRNIPASPGNFNPHFRKGSDRKLDSNICRSHISIHTSAREVTDGYWLRYSIVDISIHTSAREVTAAGVAVVGSDISFQSTLPQGKWQLNALHYLDKDIFQSTLPQGKWRCPRVRKLR